MSDKKRESRSRPIRGSAVIRTGFVTAARERRTPNEICTHQHPPKVV